MFARTHAPTEATFTKGTLALSLIGASLYWPLLRRNSLFYSLAGHDATQAQAILWYVLFLAVAAIIVAISIVIAKRYNFSLFNTVNNKSFKYPLVAIGIAAVQFACKLAEAFAPLVSWANTVVAFVDTALYACVFVMLTYLWALWFLSLDPRRSSLLVIATFGLSFPIKFATALPSPLNTILMAIAPLVSILCCLGCLRHVNPSSMDSNRMANAIQPTVAGAQPRYPRALIIILALFLLAGGFVRGLISAPINGSISMPPLAMDAMSIVFAVLAFMYCWHRTSSKHMAQTAWSVLAIIFYAGLLLMPAFGAEQYSIGGQTVIQARTYFELFLWLVLLGSVREGGLELTKAFGGIFIITDALSGFIGYALPPIASDLLGIQSAGMTATMAAIITFLLIVATILVLNIPLGQTQKQEILLDEVYQDDARQPNLENASSNVVNVVTAAAKPMTLAFEMPASTAVRSAVLDEAEQIVDKAADDMFDNLAQQYNLTERETDVAKLLADGNTQKRIAELEGVSLGTVQSHIKGVYRKLGIHSKQELIDMTHEHA